MKKLTSILLACSILNYGYAVTESSTSKKASAPILSVPDLNPSPKQNNESGNATTNLDRYENYNRNVYRFNDKFDKYILRPTAVGYVHYVPSPVRTVIANFYGNLRDFISLGNDILQLNGTTAMATVMRISINSTFGIAGFIDISSGLGLIEQRNSFGNTFKFYGWTHSSYYVIPLLGPSTVRDALGIIPDIVFNPTWYLIQDQYISVGLFALNAVDARTKFLGVDQILETSVDPYATLRDTYLGSIGEPIPQSNSANNESIDDILGDSPSTPESGVKALHSIESGISLESGSTIPILVIESKVTESSIATIDFIESK